MSIQQEVTRLREAKDAIRKVLQDNGIEVPQTATLDEYPELLRILVGSRTDQGWFATEQELKSAIPSGQPGYWALVGNTRSLWLWDDGSNGWVNSVDDMYTSTQANTDFKKINDRVYMVRNYAAYNQEIGGRLLSRVLALPQGVTAGINQFAVSIEVESESDCFYDRFVQINSNTASVYFRKRDGSNFSSGDSVWFSAIVVVNR